MHALYIVKTSLVAWMLYSEMNNHDNIRDKNCSASSFCFGKNLFLQVRQFYGHFITRQGESSTDQRTMF